MFPNEDLDFSCVMIRGDVGEDPLSPALRDIKREGAGDQNCTRHTVVTPSLSGTLVQRRSAKGQKTSFTTKFKKRVLPRRQFLNQV